MKYPVKQLNQSQRTLYELLMSAFFLCFGVNLLSAGIFELTCLVGIIKTIVGFSVCLGVFIFMARSYMKTVNRQITIQGFLVYDEKKKEIVIVPEYLGSVVMYLGINNGIRCNDSIKKEWNSGPLVETNDEYIMQLAKVDGFNAVKPQWITNDSTRSATVLNEFLQYEMIQLLTSSINVENSKRNIKTKALTTRNAPELLKHNRFFTLFTDEEEYKKNSKKYGTASYHRFNVSIPKDCSITVSDKNDILVNDKLYQLRIKSWFSGTSSVSDDFLWYYLGIERNSESKAYSINISVDVKIKFAILFSPKRKTYIDWIDKFLEKLQYYYSTDNFMERIHWNAFKTIASYYERINKK